MSHTDRNKVLMIGLDAADIDYIQLSLGRLPNLRQRLPAGRRYFVAGATGDGNLLQSLGYVQG